MPEIELIDRSTGAELVRLLAGSYVPKPDSPISPCSDESAQRAGDRSDTGGAVVASGKRGEEVESIRIADSQRII